MNNLNEALSDTILVYTFMKRLAKPWEEWEAFKLGIIDKAGLVIKKPVSSAERNVWTVLDKFIANIKRIMQKFVGKSKMASYLTVAYLLRDNYENILHYSNGDILQEEAFVIGSLSYSDQLKFHKMIKSMPLPLVEESTMQSNIDDVSFYVHKYWKGVDSLMEEYDIKVMFT